VPPPKKRLTAKKKTLTVDIEKFLVSQVNLEVLWGVLHSLPISPESHLQRNALSRQR
jgi:hypothetical protein